MAGKVSVMSYDDYYKRQLEEARQYQDYCSSVFIHHLGLAMTNYLSRHYQYKKGENIQGIEIKYDKKFRETGNLYIELAEKSNPNNPDFIASGIYRLDNTWLYSIGDYETIYVLCKSLLQFWAEAKCYPNVKTSTSIGYLLPICKAEKFCAKKINLPKGEQGKLF